MRQLSVPLFLIILTFFVAAPGCKRDAMSPQQVAVEPVPEDSMKHVLTGLPEQSRQAILVTAKAPDPSSAVIRAYLRGRNGWTPALPAFDGVVGRNGLAEIGTKREGDGRTPSGVYPLELVFGYAAAVNTKMPYRQATQQDIWVDDVDSTDYNRWVTRGETKATSFEELRRNDNLYKYGIVIGYNTDPVVRGHGSAIFIHLWKNKNTPTSGCVAMAEEDLLQILAWLDPGQKPVVALTSEKNRR